jgi:hypothetical protein
MPWTDAALVNEYLPAIDLIAEPAAFDNSIVVAEEDLRARLIVFIADATVAGWTLVANTPPIVVSWATEMAAAYFKSTFQGFHLQPLIPDNPAAWVYDRVLKQIKAAKSQGLIILDVAGARVSVAGITVSTPRWRYITYLPTHEGGEIDP